MNNNSSKDTQPHSLIVKYVLLERIQNVELYIKFLEHWTVQSCAMSPSPLTDKYGGRDFMNQNTITVREILQSSSYGLCRATTLKSR